MQNNIIHMYQHMKSVAIHLCPNDTGTDYQLGSIQLMKWLGQYDHWFKESVGIPEGKHAGTLYNRQISVYGGGILSLPNVLRELAKTVIHLGFAFSITVDIKELYHNFSFIRSLCDESLLSEIGIYSDNISALEEQSLIEAFIDQIVALRRPIGLIGSVELLRSYKILTMDSLNGSDITLYPLSYHDSIVSKQTDVSPEKSCANHLQLYINSDGYLYPCLGLLGSADYSIGHIGDDISETALSGNASMLDLFKLFKEGPGMNENTKPLKSSTSLPLICERHRMELSANV